MPSQQFYCSSCVSSLVRCHRKNCRSCTWPVCYNSDGDNAGFSASDSGRPEESSLKEHG